MKYRIVRRKDLILDQDHYYLQQKEHWWNSWTDCNAHRCTTLESAYQLLDTFLQQQIITPLQ